MQEVQRRRFLGAGVAAASGAGTKSKAGKSKKRSRSAGASAAAAGGNALTSPMQGTIVKIAAAEGDVVAEGDLIVVLEAMKMEQPLTAHKAGTVRGLTASAGFAGWVEFLCLRETLKKRIGGSEVPFSFLTRVWGAALIAAAASLGGGGGDGPLGNPRRLGGAASPPAPSNKWLTLTGG